MDNNNISVGDQFFKITSAMSPGNSRRALPKNAFSGLLQASQYNEYSAKKTNIPFSPINAISHIFSPPHPASIFLNIHSQGKVNKIIRITMVISFPSCERHNVDVILKVESITKLQTRFDWMETSALDCSE